MAHEKANGLIRVNFSSRGFVKTLGTRQSLSGFTPNPIALLSFSRFLASIRIPSQGAPTFLSIPEFRGIDYVGYIIEKERLDPTNGTWKRISEYHVIGAKSNSYKDSRVAYGQTYRYRIRAVVKFTTFNNPDSLNNTLATLSLLKAVQSALNSAITANKKVIELSKMPGQQSKSSAQQARDIGNSVGLTGGNFFSFNVLDPTVTSRLTSLQTNVNSWLAKISGTTPANDADLASYINQLIAAGVVVPRQLKTYYSEYIASYPSRNWKYITIAEQELPDPPASIKIVPNTQQKIITIYWLTPVDAQLDLAYFSLYRRESIDKPWDLLQDRIPLTQAFYIDKSVSTDKKYIYAMTSTDLHGYKSFLSLQIQAQLNPRYTSKIRRSF